jgi:hypothetical protein
VPKASEYKRFNQLLKKMNELIERASHEGNQALGFRTIKRRTALERRGLRGPALGWRSPVSAYCDY